jgi:hypothetical protein
MKTKENEKKRQLKIIGTQNKKFPNEKQKSLLTTKNKEWINQDSKKRGASFRTK